jgi:molecular chaperone GrpE
LAEAKRDEEKIFSYDTGEAADITSEFSANDSAQDDPPSMGESPLSIELAKLRAEKEDLLQTLVRRQADFDNYKKRVDRDRQEEGRRGVERLVTDLIPVLDGFDRAIQAHDDPAFEEYRKGVTLIRKQLWEALARHGAQRIDAENKMFDPHVHQAIERAESNDHPDGFILHVFQDGYTFHGRVIRPAIVRVVVHAGKDSNSVPTEN